MFKSCLWKGWFLGYIDSLSADDKLKVRHDEGEKVFKFGGGDHLRSSAHYSLPAVLAGGKKASKQMLSSPRSHCYSQKMP